MSSYTIDDFIDRIRGYDKQPFLAGDAGQCTYAELATAIDAYREKFADLDASSGVVGLATDYSLDGIAALLALWSRRACVALLPAAAVENPGYANSGRIRHRIAVNDAGDVHREELSAADEHELLGRLRKSGNPGLILFSSGSSGEPKAVLHDVRRFLGKFQKPGKALVTFGFLVFDHVAGQDTLLYTLNAGGTLVTAKNRRPHTVAKLVAAHKVQVLPASPTFLNLLIAARAHEEHDMSSVEIVTYGSEPMSQGTLDELAQAFPRTKVIQKYGTSEFGAIRSKSRSNTSLFINIKADETEAQVRDGLLWIRSPSTMLGYLNADALFDDEGWICTGDMVEQDGDWVRILGRASDLINVGGEKVVPGEVESCILQLDFVIDATVRGESNPLTGMMVVADVSVSAARDVGEPKSRRGVVKEIRQHCRATLEPHKVPVDVRFTDAPMATERQKKIRR
ncbi:MAG: fatty acid--CoA ligase family protein [Pseudomonadota bacterium]